MLVREKDMKEKMSWEKIRIAIGIVTICMIAITLLANQPKQNQFAVTNDNFTWDKNWTLVDVENQVEETVNLPITFEKEFGEYIIIKNTIPESDYSAFGLRMEVYQSDVWIYVEEDLLYEYVYEPGIIDNRAGGSGIIMINIPNEYIGKEIYIEFGRSLAYYPVKIVAPQIINAAIDNGYIDSNYLWIIAAMISYLFTGIFLLASYYFELYNGRKVEKALLSLGGVFISIACWMLCYNKVYTNISETWVFLHIIEYVSFYAMPYCILSYIHHLQTNRVIQFLRKVALVFLVATIWLKFIFGIDFLYFLTLSHILMAIHILAAMITLILGFRKGALSYKLFAIGLMLLLGSSSYGLVNIHFFNSDVKFVISFMIGISVGGLVLQLSTICLSNERLFQKNKNTFIQNKAIEYERYESILGKSGGFFFDWDRQKNTIHLSQRVSQYFAVDIPEENFDSQVFKEICKELKITYDFSNVVEKIKRQGNFYRLECDYLHESGEVRWLSIEATLSLGVQGEESHITGIIRDITNDKHQEDYLVGLSREDQLTGLMNKKTFIKEATRVMKKCGEDESHALFVMDVDYFKNINDTFGHLCGDQVIVDCANAISSHFRKKDMVARFGGDEYVVLMKDADHSAVKKRCEELNECLRKEYAVDGKVCNISLSIGVSMIPEHGKSYEHVFSAADRAVYESKQKGRDTYTIFFEN